VVETDPPLTICDFIDVQIVVDVTRKLVTPGTSLADLQNLAVIFREAETGALPIGDLAAAVRERTRFGGFPEYWTAQFRDHPFDAIACVLALLSLIVAVLALRQDDADASPRPIAPDQVEQIVTQVQAQYEVASRAEQGQSRD
jgi:hypothetical protein